MNWLHKYKKSFLFFSFLLILTGCSSVDIDDFAGSEPPLLIEEYFEGETVAWGMVQDRFGNVQKRFKVLMNGEVRNNRLTLNEEFVYSDGTSSTRVWEIDILGDGQYEGRASDIVGVAIGRSAGNAFNFKYRLRLPINGKEWVLSFDDWMYLQEDNMMLNIATMSKWGIKLGTVTVAFEKL